MAADDVRDALARKLSTTTTCHGEEWPSEFHYRQADALLPVVDRIAREAAAKALRKYADEEAEPGGALRRRLLARADAAARGEW